MKKNLLLIALFLVCVTCQVHAQIITTFAGGGTAGLGDGGPAIDAAIGGPIGVAIDAAGNTYIGNRYNNRIRKINTTGVITTIAGTGSPGYSGDGGNATAAELNGPYGVAVDNAGNVYFADGYNYCIRKINTSGIISTIAGNDTIGFRGDNGPATAAELSGIAGVAVDATGNVYITDGGNNRVRKINTAGIITTIAGTGTAGNAGDNGPATAAELNAPYAILLDGSGNLYIGGQYGGQVRKINTDGIISTIAGTGTDGFSGDNGPATAAELANAVGLALDEAGNLYISDGFNYRIRKVNASGIITTYAGNGNPDYNGDDIAASAAQLQPVGLALDATGNLYIADYGNNRIRRITSTVSVPNVNAIGDYISLHPNPSTGSFTFNLSSTTDEKCDVIITNIVGERVKEFTTTTNTPINIQLNVPNGIYFLTAITAHRREFTKLMIQQ